MKKCLVLLLCCSMPILARAADCGVPKLIKPLEGLIDESKVRQGDASIIADIASKRVALIVSSNAEKQLAWNESLRQPLTGFARLATELAGTTDQWEKGTFDTYDPKIILDRITAPFVSAAKQTKPMADLAEFRDSGFELAIVLDINFRCQYDRNFSGVTDWDSGVEIAAYPLSPAFVMGPVVYGRGVLKAKYQTGAAESARGRQEESNMRIAAARDFHANVARAYPGVKPAPSEARPGPAAGGAAPVAGAVAPRSVEVRLQAVEDLRLRGLISDLEAGEKRKEILKDL